MLCAPVSNDLDFLSLWTRGKERAVRNTALRFAETSGHDVDEIVQEVFVALFEEFATSAEPFAQVGGVELALGHGTGLNAWLLTRDAIRRLSGRGASRAIVPLDAVETQLTVDENDAPDERLIAAERDLRFRQIISEVGDQVRSEATLRSLLSSPGVDDEALDLGRELWNVEPEAFPVEPVQRKRRRTSSRQRRSKARRRLMHLVKDEQELPELLPARSA